MEIIKRPIFRIPTRGPLLKARDMLRSLAGLAIDVSPGDTVRADVTWENTGNMAGDFDVEVSYDGISERVSNISSSPGEIKTTSVDTLIPTTAPPGTKDATVKLYSSGGLLDSETYPGAINVIALPKAEITSISATKTETVVEIQNTGSVTASYEIDVVITDSASGSGCDIGNGYVYHTCTKMVVSNLAPGSKATKTCTYSLDPGTYYAIGFVYQRDGPCLDGRYVSFVVEEPPPPPPILFKSGFETGNLSEWDDVIRDASCVHYYVSSVIRHSGSHGFCADFYNCYPNIRHVHLFKYALTPAVPGRKIRPSIWVHDNIWGGYLIQLTFYKGITRISSHVEYKDVPPWNKLKWIKLTYSSVTIPSGCDNIALMLKVGAWDGDTAVDDILLEYL